MVTGQRKAADLLANGSRLDPSAALANHVVDFIRSEGLGPGDRLPSAKALAARFSVATPTLREALRRLQATGLIDIKHGSGIYVRRTHDRMMLANPHSRPNGFESRAILDLLDARLLIEPTLAHRAAERATPDDLADLERILAEAAAQISAPADLLHHPNMLFHARIAVASGNQVLAEVMESLVELHSPEQHAILWIFNARERDHQDHLRIYHAIWSRAPAVAHDRMRRHLEEVRAVVAGRIAVEREALTTLETP